MIADLSNTYKYLDEFEGDFRFVNKSRNYSVVCNQNLWMIRLTWSIDLGFNISKFVFWNLIKRNERQYFF